MDICLAGLANSTHKQYDYHLLAFKSFCSSRGLHDHLSVSLSTGIEFLTKLYKEGKSYSTINSARSALSQFIHLSDCSTDTDFGKHTVTTKFMRGVFKLRPPVAKYNNTWDVKIVLDLLRKWDNTTVSLKHLSLKCVTLLALALGQRVQTLSALDISSMNTSVNEVVFSLKRVLKTSKPGFQQPITIFRFTDDPMICPLLCLETYLTQTKDLRKSSSLFISFQRPHAAVTAQTLSRWIYNVLQECGISPQFKAHSTRGASTSKAALHLDTNSILRTVGWRCESTFARFYNRPINTDDSFSNVVLGSK
jgi:site-specific recombinase XerD